MLQIDLQSQNKLQTNNTCKNRSNNWKFFMSHHYLPSASRKRIANILNAKKTISNRQFLMRNACIILLTHCKPSISVSISNLTQGLICIIAFCAISFYANCKWLGWWTNCSCACALVWVKGAIRNWSSDTTK